MLIALKMLNLINAVEKLKKNNTVSKSQTVRLRKVNQLVSFIAKAPVM